MATKNDSLEQAEPAETDAPGERAAPSRAMAIWDQVSTLILAVGLALGIRAFAIEPFRIPSGSMLPTLLIGDHLFVNKFVYGPRIPFTGVRLPGLREPQRGDVVVFEVGRGDGHQVPTTVPADKYPDLPREDYVKRIVGVPGDRISVRRGQVTVNGHPMPQWDTGLAHVDDAGRTLRIRTEDLAGCAHAVLDDPRAPDIDKESMVVPEGRYFMMGDNRDYSHDSRSWGTVRFTEFKGPAFILYWSWEVNGNALQFFNPYYWFTADKRWDRVFKRVRCETPAEARESIPGADAASHS